MIQEDVSALKFYGPILGGNQCPMEAILQRAKVLRRKEY